MVEKATLGYTTIRLFTSAFENLALKKRQCH